MRTNGGKNADQIKIKHVVGDRDHTALKRILVPLEIFAPVDTQPMRDPDQQKSHRLQPQPVDRAQALKSKALLQVRVIGRKVNVPQLLDLYHVLVASLGVGVSKIIFVIHIRHPLLLIRTV